MKNLIAPAFGRLCSRQAVALTVGTVVAIGLLSHVSAAIENGDSDEKPRMLMVTQSAGFRHQPVNRGEKAMSSAEQAILKLSRETGLFDVDFSQDVATHLTRENLQNYNLVLFYTSGNLPAKAEDLDYLLSEWVRQPGHGFIGLHSASDTYKDHEPYWDFIGGTFNGHPWTQNTQVTITVHEPNHPTMKPFGNQIQLKEEIYQYVHWQPKKVRVLMSLDMENTELKRPYHVPVAWIKQVGEGRMYYNNLGHRPDTWENEKFLQSIANAVRWIGSEDPGNMSPNPEVSRRQHELSVAAAKAAGITEESLAAEQRAQQERKRAREAAKQKAAQQSKDGSGK